MHGAPIIKESVMQEGVLDTTASHFQATHQISLIARRTRLQLYYCIVKVNNRNWEREM